MAEYSKESEAIYQAQLQRLESRSIAIDEAAAEYINDSRKMLCDGYKAGFIYEYLSSDENNQAFEKVLFLLLNCKDDLAKVAVVDTIQREFTKAVKEEVSQYID